MHTQRNNTRFMENINETETLEMEADTCKNSSVFTAVWSNGGITLLDDIAIIHRYSCGMGGSRV